MTAPSPSQVSPRARALFGLLFITLLFAPLFRAGLAPLPLLALELLALSLLGLALWNPGGLSIKPMEIIALVLILLLPLLYLVYLPAGILDGIPGQGAYRANLARVFGEGLDGALSLVALQTQTSWLVLLIPIAVFLATRSLGQQSQLRLVSLLLAIAAFQATLALVQFGASQGGLLLFGFDPSGSGAAGTYPNRNHLAGLLEMTLPIALALLLYYLGRDRSDRKRGWRRKVSFFASLRGHTALVYGALAILLVLGIIFTRSRTGIALAMLGILLTTILYSRRIGGDNVYGPTGTLVVIVVGIGVSIGLAPVLDRFSFGGALEDARWTISAAAIEGLATFLPFG
ncbi:MAG: O-antigen ligase domain-containing protein, partial [Chromatiaceae bacterium]|nr:O-antigen ligase domain-containing protein [Chromatiaceae bacterium]